MMKEAQQQVERAVEVDGLRVEPRRQRNALVHDAAAQLCSSICFLRGGRPSLAFSLRRARGVWGAPQESWM